MSQHMPQHKPVLSLPCYWCDATAFYQAYVEREGVTMPHCRDCYLDAGHD